jgi:hypothetical protein
MEITIREIVCSYESGQYNLVQTVRALMKQIDRISVFSLDVAAQIKSIDSQTDHIVVSKDIKLSERFSVVNDHEITETEKLFGPQMHQIIAAIAVIMSKYDRS